MEERHLSLGEVAQLLDKSERTIRRWVKSGKLKAYKPGRDYLIPESAIRELMEASEVYPKAQPPLPLEVSEGAAGGLAPVPDAIEELMRRHAADYESDLRDPGSPHFVSVARGWDWVEMVSRDADRYIEWVSDYAAVLQPQTNGIFDKRTWQNALKLVGQPTLTFGVIISRAKKRIEAMEGVPDALQELRLKRAEEAERARSQRVAEIEAALRKTASG